MNKRRVYSLQRPSRTRLTAPLAGEHQDVDMASCVVVLASAVQSAGAVLAVFLIVSR